VLLVQVYQSVRIDKSENVYIRTSFFYGPDLLVSPLWSDDLVRDQNSPAEEPKKCCVHLYKMLPPDQIQKLSASFGPFSAVIHWWTLYRSVQYAARNTNAVTPLHLATHVHTRDARASHHLRPCFSATFFNIACSFLPL
jgi:hypothetical protein